MNSTDATSGFTLTVNGQKRLITPDAESFLLDAIREDAFYLLLTIDYLLLLFPTTALGTSCSVNTKAA